MDLNVILLSLSLVKNKFNIWVYWLQSKATGQWIKVGSNH